MWAFLNGKILSISGMPSMGMGKSGSVGEGEGGGNGLRDYVFTPQDWGRAVRWRERRG